MDNVFTIAGATFSRHARSKALYLLWVLLIVLIAAADRYDVLSIGRARILMVDLGLALISVVGAGSILVLGFEIPRELRQRLAENLLSKPIGRDQYLLGKFFGTLAFALSNVLFVSAGFAVVLFFTRGIVTEQLLIPLVGIIGMLLILAAAGAFFGSFLNEVPAVVATFLVFWLGHSTQAVAQLASRPHVGESLRLALRFLYGLLPNLSLLNTRVEISQSLFANAPRITWDFTALSFGYAVLYAFVLFWAAMLVFRQRDL